jgi:hypothetical protein
VQIVCVRERSSLANNNNVACTVAKERGKQIVDAKRESNTAAERGEPDFSAAKQFWLGSFVR